MHCSAVCVQGLEQIGLELKSTKRYGCVDCDCVRVCILGHYSIQKTIQPVAAGCHWALFFTAGASSVSTIVASFL